MDVREKLVELIHKAKLSMWGKNGLSNEKAQNSYIADYLITHGVTVQEQAGFDGEWIVKGQEVFCSHCNEESGYNAWGASAFSNYCPNCGKKMTPQPPKGE